MRNIWKILLPLAAVVVVVTAFWKPGWAKTWEPRTEKVTKVTSAPTRTPTRTSVPTCAPTATPVPPTATSVWPTTANEAAKLFGASEDRWESIFQGDGWHLRESPNATKISPHGYAMEGYRDTEPGKDPIMFVSVETTEAQGCTIWKFADPGTLIKAMAQQKKTDVSQIRALGFDRPSTN